MKLRISQENTSSTKVILKRGKMLIIFAVLLLFMPESWAQIDSLKTSFLFQGPETKEQIRIEVGSKVSVTFKTHNIKTKGVVLSLSDSSLTLGFDRRPNQQIVPYWNIENIEVIASAKRKYAVRITLNNGEKVRGALIRTMQDSVSILINYSYEESAPHRESKIGRFGVSEIRVIRIRKGAVGGAIATGACSGAVLGVIVGLAIASEEGWHPGESAWLGIIGGAAGSLAGAVIWSTSGKKFEINGNQAQFDLFAKEYKYK